MSRKKGSRYERQLSNLFSDAGWYVQKAAVSGSATDKELPDVLAAKDGHVVVMELKYTKKDIAYADEEKIRGLRWVAEQLDGEPYLVARWKGDTTFYAFPLRACGRTDAGNYRAHRENRNVAVELPFDV